MQYAQHTVRQTLHVRFARLKLSRVRADGSRKSKRRTLEFRTGPAVRSMSIRSPTLQCGGEARRSTDVIERKAVSGITACEHGRTSTSTTTATTELVADAARDHWSTAATQ